MTAVKILLSTHARNLQANILHLDQKAVKCTTCKWLFSKFWLFIARKWPENGLTRFKTHFLAKFPREGLIKLLVMLHHCTKALFALWQKTEFGSQQFFVFATLLASETCKVFRLRSCLQNKMTSQRIAVKEKRRLSPDKTLFVKKILCTRNDFLLTELFAKQTKFCFVRKGSNKYKIRPSYNFFTTLLKKLSH